ncbi:hypothetical protein L1049_008786 [Liquidambar formosana]|uniref:Uncharacterized protein n=1 Tax=Liquidambar formosana TaxID=63359 RepID=A0AAP0SB97_LIQFO
MADKVSNEVILEQLRHGIAEFKLTSSPVASVSTTNCHKSPATFLGDNSHGFFARIGPALGRGSSAMRKLEHYSVQKVTGDWTLSVSCAGII